MKVPCRNQINELHTVSEQLKTWGDETLTTRQSRTSREVRAHVDREELVVAVNNSLLGVDEVKVGLLKALLCEIRAEGAEAIRVPTTVCMRE
jgi:hypothetical protein